MKRRIGSLSSWSPDLSKVYVDAEPVGQLVARKRMTLDERIEKAKTLRARAFSFGQISTMLGVSRQTAKNYVDDYPYKKNNR